MEIRFKDNQRIFYRLFSKLEGVLGFIILLGLLVVKFLEDVEPSGSVYPQRFHLEETRELTEAPSYERCLIVLMENQVDYLELQSVLELSTHEE
jgi:hypothetical protein